MLAAGEHVTFACSVVARVLLGLAPQTCTPGSSSPAIGLGQRLDALAFGLPFVTRLAGSLSVVRVERLGVIAWNAQRRKVSDVIHLRSVTNAHAANVDLAAVPGALEYERVESAQRPRTALAVVSHASPITTSGGLGETPNLRRI